MWDYTEKVREHFLNPRNVGEIENPDAVGEVGNITCGDALRLTLRIDKETQRIVDAKFKTFGCASAIASSSALTEIIKGKTLEEALQVGNEQIAEFLGGLPEEKMHCSVMGRDALEAAFANYRGLHYESSDEDEGRLVCRCFGVTDEKIKRVVRENHLTTVEEVTHYCKAGGGCGSCLHEIEDLIKEVHGEQSLKEPEPKQKRKLTNLQKIALIQKVVQEEIRPVLAKDNGDLVLMDVVGNRVLVSLRGSCAGCPVAPITLKSYVQEKLRELVSEDLVVEEVPS